MQSTNRFDAIIIGGGHNGLTAAAYLAKAGLEVLVLERRGVLGGGAATEPVFPGFRINTGALDSGLFLPEIVAELRLQNHGLRFLHSPVVACALQPDDNALPLWRDPQRAAEEIARISPGDAARYLDYVRWIGRMAKTMRQVFLRIPPAIPRLPPGELLSWLPSALKIRSLGKNDLMALMRALPMPLYDFLSEWFEHPAVRAAVGAGGMTGVTLGPRAPGTAFNLFYQALNAGQAGFRASSFVQGGMGALSQALAEAAQCHGAEVRTGAAVARLDIENDKVSQVVLESGETLTSRVVLSSANPRHTFFDLIGAQNLDARIVREVKNIRFRGSVARLNLALSGLPAFLGPPTADEPRALLSGHILVCPSLDYLERAYDEAKYGGISSQPFLDMHIPTLLDDSLAPAGKHILSINIQYAPYHLRETNWQEQRSNLVDLALRTLETYAPGIGALIEDQQLLTPLDLEREFSLAEGCIFHGQMALDQLWFMRPIPGLTPYRTPLANLYLCGAGAHPGGGVSGAAGRNAARLVLRQIDQF